ncbi:TetR/AcrR family transcriptional regulator [Quadrisphaera oryzae]|uniref:TetR/AcrR family transcriptional regulator n=1 Tax=Quadrisphaera TaxID=317661 RepID=UPI001646DAA0|nr:TetR family transcriptional regulator C-terminal domain-containing protein [Quadrisphaera sp. RL12-1S]
MRAGSTRDALVAAALRVVEREGLPALTTRRVAAEAGLPLGTVHYWFTDKRQLVATTTDALLQEVRERSAGATDLRDAHRRLAAVPAGRQLALVELTTAALRDPALADLARQQYAAYRATALQQLAELVPRADADLPGGSEALATLVVAVLDGLTLSTLAEDDDEGRGRARADAAVELLLDLLQRHRDRVAPPGDAP